MNPITVYLLPALFIILPVCLLYLYQNTVCKKDRFLKLSCSFEKILNKRYLVSSDLIEELSQQNLLENSIILKLIELRSASMKIESVFDKLEIEGKISTAYANIIKKLVFTGDIPENSSLHRYVSQWEILESNLFCEKQSLTELTLELEQSTSFVKLSMGN